MAKLIVANWKMHATIDKVVADVKYYLQYLSRHNVDNNHVDLNNNVVLALPYPFLSIAYSLINNYNSTTASLSTTSVGNNCNTAAMLKLASQDVSEFGFDGAYTGEVSANMLASIGVSYAIIGHSERRHYFAASNEVSLQKKITNCLMSSIVPILCVGEDANCRRDNNHYQYIISQLNCLEPIKDALVNRQLIISYEPLWAIGSGLHANAVQIIDMMAIIKSFMHNNLPCIKVKTLYGGSVNAANANEILTIDNVDGVLVGGASLKTEEFTAIIGN